MAEDSRVFVGPAGWSYDDWEGKVYEAGLGAKRLDAVAALFRVIEINSSFYGSPKRHSAEAWLRRIEQRPDFRFTAKLVRLFTHENPKTWTVKGRDDFVDGLAPLHEAGRLGAVLVQFPWFYDATSDNLHRLARIRKAFPDYPLVIEVRHRSWLEDDWLEQLSELQYSFCNVDQPLAEDSIELGSIVTGPVGYLRLHGRNRTKWFSKNAEVHEKYDYLYAADEVARLVRVAEEIRSRSEQLFVIANNHFEGKGPANALEIIHGLSAEPVDVPTSLIRTYPHLARIARSKESEPAARARRAGGS